MPLLRRLRGLLGLAVTGAVGWVTLGVTFDVILSVVQRHQIHWSGFLRVLPAAAGFGAICGLVFGGLLLLLERRRGFGDLSLARIATWGALGGLGIPLLFSTVQFTNPLTTIAIYGTVGALISTGTLVIARRAPALGPGSAARQLKEPL